MMAKTTKKPNTGNILIAEPFMWDMNFRRSVVLLCETNKKGAMGFILNKPLDLDIKDAIEGIAELDLELNFGGPVQTDTMHFLHNLGDKIENSTKIAEGIYWGGNFEIVKSLLLTGEAKTDNFRFFLGYTGWDFKQLNEEINADSWMIGKCNADYVFSKDSKNLWKKVLEDMGGEYKVISNYPVDPTLN